MNSVLRLGRLVLPLLCVAPLALLSACDDSDDSDDSNDEHAEHGHEEGEADCAMETRDDEFAVGLSKSGELVTATFVSADPAPPIKGDNTWVLRFTDVGGEALAGLTIVVNPMMPDHGHGTPVVAEVTATGTPGEYELGPVNLFMAGYWDVELSITTAGGDEDSLHFGFCVE